MFQPETIQKCVDALRSDSLLVLSTVFKYMYLITLTMVMMMIMGMITEAIVHGHYSARSVLSAFDQYQIMPLDKGKVKVNVDLYSSSL